MIALTREVTKVGKAYSTTAEQNVAKYDCQELLHYLLSTGMRQEIGEVFQ